MNSSCLRRNIAAMIDGASERRGKRPVLCCAVFFFILLLSHLLPAVAQESTPRRDAPPADTTRPAGSDSLRAVDSLAGADTLDPHDSTDHDHAPAPSTRLAIRDVGAPLGSLTLKDDAAGYDLVQKHELVWERYFTAFDVLAERLPAYPLSQGGPGLVRGFSYAGSSPDAVSTLFNGRPLWGPGGRGYDLELFPLEFTERAEILRGARAAVFGGGESLIAINFPQPRYDVEGSYVRLWYAQGANNTSNADITYARNVGDRANFSLGFRRLSGDGVYTNIAQANANQRVSGWSGRGTLRWDLAENLAVSLTEIFSDATRGINGGLTPESGRVGVLVDVENDTLRERTLRHDVTLATRWYPRFLDPVPGDTIPADTASGDTTSADTTSGTESMAPLPDTTFRVDGALYFSAAEHELQVGDRAAQLAGARQQSNIFGARAGFTIPLDRFSLLANGVIEYSDDGRVRFEGGGLLDLALGDIFTARGGGKIHGYGDDLFATITGEGVVTISDALALRGTIRSMTLLETSRVCLQDNQAVLWNRLSDHYTGSLVEGALEWRDGGTRIDLEGFVRGAVPYCDADPAYTVLGASLFTRIPYSFLTLENHLIGTFSDNVGFTGIPLVHGTSDLYAQLRLFGGNLDLRLGTVLDYMSSSPTISYPDELREFAVPQGSTLPSRPPFPVWTAYGQARIGAAYIRVEMFNILDNSFYTVYRYPVFGRAVNISVNWALID